MKNTTQEPLLYAINCSMSPERGDMSLVKHSLDDGPPVQPSHPSPGESSPTQAGSSWDDYVPISLRATRLMKYVYDRLL